ncbi:bi-domain-containing oxidoreductase [uncultured Prochlorococcus sp.]|uniref:bi-domain-containing oxidoreductase n=1 Tax=uncultured Prochlorococcus sp. TaxID=159733 RepID=UPI00258E66DB|nr:bi-domain-containing oxidoreductase [uncultured Prochlorococcus sp.]
MKQLVQNLSEKSTSFIEIPCPKVDKGEILIETSKTLLSAGTERMLVDFSKSNIVEKIKKQPDKTKDVINKLKTDGIIPTLEAVSNKLNSYIPLGYCNVGTIKEIGKDVDGFKIGDRVLSNGPHSEYVVVPKNLCALIPRNVVDEDATFTVLGAIGLQGTRLANPTFGETFVVIGLGLIGLLTCQLLQAQGCIVYGFDLDKKRCKLAETFGIKTYDVRDIIDVSQWLKDNLNGMGVDGVIITASTTSNDPVTLAADLCRKRGRIILVGVTGLNLRRDLFYKKELLFQVSCSYGPGRYDPTYEENGNDYPIGFVRWTEKRNFEAVLNALSRGSLDVKKLISHRFDFNDANKGYDLLTNSKDILGIIFDYPKKDGKPPRVISLNSNKNSLTSRNNCNVSFIGAGNYASRVLVPNFKNCGANLISICSKNGLNASIVSKKFPFSKASSSYNSIFEENESDTVVIATRHNTHYQLVKEAILSNKNIFVEKPLCLKKEELQDLHDIYNQKSGNCILMVGFNRRFSKLIKVLKDNLDKLCQQRHFIFTCNAGFIEKDHWLQNKDIGGGRFIGESCHFVDLLRFLADSAIVDLRLNIPSISNENDDNFTINIAFENGSMGTIHYFSNGHKSFPKERLEVFSGGKIFRIDNFRELSIWASKGSKKKKLITQDKGQKECINAFINAIKKNESSPIPINEIFEVHSFMLKAI